MPTVFLAPIAPMVVAIAVFAVLAKFCILFVALLKLLLKPEANLLFKAKAILYCLLDAILSPLFFHGF